jgi:fructosamine-3-kinase
VNKENNSFITEIEAAIGDTPIEIRPLSGGDVGEVYLVNMQYGAQVVAKVDRGSKPQLALEAYMLSYLKKWSKLPVPEVLYSDPRLLLMEYIAGSSSLNAPSQEHAAELLAALHELTAPQFGMERNTLIGGLDQLNSWTDSWLDFFREQRLLYMAGVASRAGRLPESILLRVSRFCERLDDWLAEPRKPSLIHGDAWTGNILVDNDRVTGFLDPAIYYADAEIELAFSTLFGTFGDPFFARYEALRPLEPGFMDTRRDIYNLYPLLVHVRLFGGSYVRSVDGILRRFGF